MKIKDILNMDYNELVNLTRKENIKDLKQIVTQMVRVANRRINNLRKSEVGEYSPALQSLGKAGVKKFSEKGIAKMTSRDVNKLVHTYSQTKKFLQAKTSTLGGWNKVRQKVGERTGAKNLFKREYKSKRSATFWHNREKRFWKLYNQLVDNYGGIISQLDSNRIQQMLYKIQDGVANKNIDTVSDVMNKYVKQLYEAQQRGEDVDDDEFEKEFNINF